jgi:tryptophan-rich sensory protein
MTFNFLTRNIYGFFRFYRETFSRSYKEMSNGVRRGSLTSKDSPTCWDSLFMTAGDRGETSLALNTDLSISNIVDTLKKDFLGRRWTAYYAFIALLYLISVYFVVLGTFSDWYASLRQPSWSPSLILSILIGIVVYGLSFYGLYVAFEKIYGDPERNLEVYEFFMITITISTGLLTIWSYLFFIARAVGLSILFIFLGFIVYLVLIIEIGILYPLAGLLNVPYLLYLLYFVVFTSWIYIENPQIRQERI